MCENGTWVIILNTELSEKKSRTNQDINENRLEKNTKHTKKIQNGFHDIYEIFKKQTNFCCHVESRVYFTNDKVSMKRKF